MSKERSKDLMKNRKKSQRNRKQKAVLKTSIWKYGFRTKREF